ncbi:MAG: hypothetical protein IKX72_01150 [Oscillospiraceae bacterium]|nr:hypothetical protein [Oscillospiraceae bacterium]
MSKRIITLALVAALLCSFGQLVFADIADPIFRPSRGGTFAVVLVIAALIVAVVFIIRKIRRRR